MKTIYLIIESFYFAWGALRENLLRTTLSLLGITVGIFAIIGVLTLVDTLDKSIKESVSFLGDKVVYVEKWPWGFGKGEYAWWKYMKRPVPTFQEYRFLEKNLSQAKAVSIFAIRGNLTAKYKSNTMSPVILQGVSYSQQDVSEYKIEKGRYFSPQEADKGTQTAIIGSTLAQELYTNEEPLGKFITIKGMKFLIVGVMKSQGDNLLGAPSADRMCVVPFDTMMKMYASNKRGPAPKVAMKGYETDPMMPELQAEIRGLLRAYRGLKPMQDDDFAINRSEALSDFFGQLIAGLTIGGWVIGGFSMLIGGFGIANIMFVSVKERTSLIGIQKSLGAKNFFILFQFLFESILLCIIGGLAGLLLVSGLSLLSTDTFEISLNAKNVVIGLGVSCSLGVLAGLIPAYTASKLDPVLAIRS